ncbi:energy transducer TonB family protein [Sphingobium yanoikuyae]|uniref:energy transducer TonB family protein n=1 Tax=Sphingobium yanoikuyae TaxID=13690 RepID=UPI001F1B0989|nr:energy transducer TonB [Sphingobium yanoikuyae]
MRSKILDMQDGPVSKYLVRPSGEGRPAARCRADALPLRADAAPFPVVVSNGRYSDQPLDWRSRLFGIGATAAAFLLPVAGLFLSWQAVHPLVAPAEPLVVTLQPLAAPPDPVEEVPEGPRQVEQKEQKVERKDLSDPPKVLTPLSSPTLMKLATPAPAMKVADPIPETTAPKSMPAPPATRASSDADASWEALLLAHLEKYRRFPAAARARREEGIAFVTFRMNRAGRVLSAIIGRSSGSVFLDRAALETIRRAQPLPAIPKEKADELELSVPVEFFMQQ